MYIVPMTGINLPSAITDGSNKVESAGGENDVSFLDVFENIINSAVETSQQVDKDAIDIMLGDVDNLAQIQINLEKAATAVDLLVTVKNKVVDAYNEVIRMNI